MKLPHSASALQCTECTHLECHIALRLSFHSALLSLECNLNPQSRGVPKPSCPNYYANVFQTLAVVNELLEDSCQLVAVVEELLEDSCPLVAVVEELSEDN